MKDFFFEYLKICEDFQETMNAYFSRSNFWIQNFFFHNDYKIDYIIVMLLKISVLMNICE